MQQMTNQGLAELLNDQLGLCGPDAVTSDVIRQWVAWEVLPKAGVQGRINGKGPVWSRSSAALHRARRLGELRQQGIKRETALIVQAYIEWGHPDFDSVRKALFHELAKWRAQLARRRVTFVQGRAYRELSAVQKRAIKRQLGPLDALFAGTRFQQSDEFVVMFAQLAETGDGNVTALRRLLEEAFERILPGFGRLLSIAPIDGFIDLLAGVFGSPDEIGNSAQDEIAQATEYDFRRARIAMRRMWRMLNETKRATEMPGLPRPLCELFEMLNVVARQIRTGPWAAFHFVELVMAFRRENPLLEMSSYGTNPHDLLKAFLPGLAILQE